MSLYLKIDQDENAEFFQKYDTLSPLRKKIWDKIAECTRKWLVACPSQIKIATWLGCHRSAVSEAFKLFKEWGWLALLSRGFKKSKTLLISHSKRQIDVVNRQYFKRVEATYRATHTYSTYRKVTGRKAGRLDIPIYLQKLNLSLDQKLKLALVSEITYRDALESAKLDHSRGKKINEINGYVVGTAIKMAQKRGERLEWGKYYAALSGK